MWLVICEPEDLSALWAFQGLKRRGLAPLELLSPEILANSLRWEHRIDSQGARIAIKLADGRTVLGKDVCGVLNRAYNTPLPAWRHSSASDRLYVQQELFAFYLSWLHCLSCPVLNRPTPMGLAGQWRAEPEWVCLAAKAGLPTPSFRQTCFDRVNENQGQSRLIPLGAPRRTVIAVERTVADATAPKSIADGCIRLAELSATGLLAVDFIQGVAGPWTFAGATPFPDMRAGGERFLDLLARTLRRGVNV